MPWRNSSTGTARNPGSRLIAVWSFEIRTQLESQQLAPATINVRLAVVRRLVYEAAYIGLLSSELVAGIRRVKGIPQLGRRVGNWLTASEGEKLRSGFDPRQR